MKFLITAAIYMLVLGGPLARAQDQDDEGRGAGQEQDQGQERGQARGQDQRPRPGQRTGQRSGQRPSRNANSRQERGGSQTITEEQKAGAAEIVSKYDASALSAEDAKAIHKALRDIGVQGGPVEDELLISVGFDPEMLKQMDPPPDRPGAEDGERGMRGSQGKGGPGGAGRKGGGKEGGSRYNLEQAVSDNAQLTTIAFNGLAFLTGDFGAATFIPPGKVCDFFGFQYMRDIDAAKKGHNPIFLSRVAGNVAHNLTAEQKQLFIDLAEEQQPQLVALAKLRLPVIKAFHMQKDEQLPSGSTGLNKAAVMRSVGRIFEVDAELSRRRAEVMAKVWLSLSAEQKAYFAKMKFGDFATWPELDETEAKEAGRGKPKMFNVAYMTYLSEFFSWTAGSVKADTYFCPERHGTYFGGFYMKDMPAMGKKSFDISTSVTGDSGKAFLSEVLTPAQRRHVDAVLPLQRKAMAEIIKVRQEISVELRKYLAGQAPDKEKVLALGRRYGELDGEVSWYYTMAFAKVNRTLTEEQRAALVKLRNLDGYTSAPYYIYSDGAKTEPQLGSVSAFFFPPSSGAKE